MKVNVVESDGPIVVAEVSGRINVLNADAFEAESIRAFAGSDGDVVLIASEVTYVSSAGLRAFLRLYRDLSGDGRRLYMCSLKPHIRRAFRTIGFDKIIPIHEDRETALAAAKDRAQSEG